MKLMQFIKQIILEAAHNRIAHQLTSSQIVFPAVSRYFYVYF